MEIARRYKEFLYLREMIAKRYPGLVIPQIPPKVYMNRANEVIEERQRLLNHFLQTICMHTYFAQMPEIQLFLRPIEGNAISSLRGLEKITTDLLLKYYRERLPIIQPLGFYGQAALDAYELKSAKFIEETRLMYDYVKRLKIFAAKMSQQK